MESNKFEFKGGEILFCRLRPYFHKVGVSPVEQPSRRGLDAQEVISATIEAGLIKADESVGGSRKFARYLAILGSSFFKATLGNKLDSSN